MDKDIKEKALKALERQTKQYKRQNDYIKNNYDRISVTFPKGYKNAMQKTGADSVNGYINGLVRDDLTRRWLLSDASSAGTDAGAGSADAGGAVSECPF